MEEEKRGSSSTNKGLDVGLARGLDGAELLGMKTAL